MSKKKMFAVEYMEVYRKTFLVEAESYEEAEEKVEYAAENIGGLMDLVDDFDHWEVSCSSYGYKPVPDFARNYYDVLPEE